MPDGAKYIELDEFAKSVTDLVKVPFDRIEEGSEPVIKASCQKGRRECKKEAGNLGLADKRGKDVWARYLSGFRSTTKRKNKHNVVGEIGQKNVPGLVHLIEKGHNRIGGGRVRAFPHMKPAAKSTFEYATKKFEELVQKSL